MFFADLLSTNFHFRRLTPVTGKVYQELMETLAKNDKDTFYP